MRIDNEFTVNVPIDRAWTVLTDLEGIAPCMPGAQLTGVEGEVHSGRVRVKVGPVVSEYAGTVRFVEKDEVNHRAVIDARGRDSRGAGNASAVVTALLRADGARTVVTVDTDLKISGRIAQFGSGMIKEVSGKLLGQFVDCLEGRLAADTAAATEVAGSPVSTAPPTADRRPASVPPGSEAEGVPAGTAARNVRTDPEPVPREAGEIAPAIDPEPLDVMSVAGGSVYRRVLPVLAVLVVLVAVVVYLLVA
ncbi:SRPBCC family protein [Streptosporangium sp. NPDC049644]|uniref:SRPBCC family protein n=1 Tax=Streptosporangium sp. NPDC049644 TaxID=3155507 RepID=UPI00343E7CDD